MDNVIGFATALFNIGIENTVIDAIVNQHKVSNLRDLASINEKKLEKLIERIQRTPVGFPYMDAMKFQALHCWVRDQVKRFSIQPNPNEFTPELLSLYLTLMDNEEQGRIEGDTAPLPLPDKFTYLQPREQLECPLHM
jgi:hypothetical protein